MSQFDELPEGWIICILEEISKLATGKTPSTSKDEYWNGDIPFITPSQIHPSGYIISPERTVTHEGAKQAKVIPSESILIVCIGSVGKIGYLDRDAVINQQLNALIPEVSINSKFLYYWSKHYLQNWVIQNSVATVNAAILNKTRLGTAPALVAPLNEQRRIVEKIEALTARSRKAREALEAIPNLLDQFRQSVLAAAFRGDLTADWREQNPDVEPAEVLLNRIRVERRKHWEDAELEKKRAKGKEPKDEKWKEKYKEPFFECISQLPYLPEGWLWQSVEMISTKVVDGVHKKPDYIDSGIPFVTVKNLTAGPEISFEELNYISLEDHQEFYKRANPNQGDILISKDGTLGVTRVVRTDKVFSIFVSVALVKPVDYSMSEYLELAFSAPQMQRQMLGTGSGLQHIHLKDLRGYAVPVAPLEEQCEIVRRVRHLIATVESQISAFEDTFQEIEMLDQSILAKAFRGELVPQDPNDEPANLLLERIRAERERLGNSTKRGKAKT